MFQILRKCLLHPKDLVENVTTRLFSTKTKSECPGIQVTVLGADTRVGMPTCFLLKQNPLVTVLRMQGTGKVKGMAADLNIMDRRCKAIAYDGVEKVPQALKGADIVLVMGINSSPPDFTMIDVLMAEGKRLKSLIHECTTYAPKAITVICVPPVSVTLPIAALLYKKTHWYHPGRLIGFSGLMQMEADALLGNFQTLNPQGIHVPMLGGPERDTAVPLFSQASPVAVLPKYVPKLLAKFRGIREDEFPKKMSKPYKVECYPLAEATALNRMVTTICLGICGDSNAVCAVYMRSNLILSCKHTVSEVEFARSGVVHNYGIPRLTSLELKLVEKAALVIGERESLAEEFVKYTETSKEEKEPPFRVREQKAKEQAKKGIAR